MDTIIKILGAIALFIIYFVVRSKYPDLFRNDRDRDRDRGGFFFGDRRGRDRYRDNRESLLGDYFEKKQTYSVVKKDFPPKLSKQLITLANIQKWNTRSDQIYGNNKGLSFFFTIKKLGWNLKIETPLPSMPRIELKSRFSASPDDPEYLNNTGDIKFDDAFWIKTDNPAMARLFLTDEMRDYFWRYFRTCTAITFSPLGEEKYDIAFEYSTRQEKAPTPNMVTKLFPMIEELKNLRPGVKDMEPFIFDEVDAATQRSYCHAAFLSFYGTDKFSALKERLLSHSNMYIKNLTSLIFDGELQTSGYSIGQNADTLGEIYFAMAKGKGIKVNTAPLQLLYPKIKNQIIKDKIIKMSLVKDDGKNETFLLSLLKQDLPEERFLTILTILKNIGTTESVDALKAFKDRTEVKKLDDAADEAIKTIIKRIDGFSLDGRLSFVETSNAASAGLSIADEE